MDPITQGAFGAVFAQTQGTTKDLAKAAVIGAIAGMAPDLDVLIKSAEDPLLALQFHRHFSHSLLFIPIGGLLCSLLLHPLLGRRFGLTFLQTFIYSLIGFATHGLLDGCTSYGTQLLWPFSDKRFAWDIIAIIDPLVTLPLLGFIILAARRKARRYSIIAILWVGMYFGFSSYQHQRALDEGKNFAISRGLEIQHIEAKPSFANIFIWKVITTTNDAYYVDAVKVSWKKPVFWQGDTVKKLSISRDLPWLDENSQQRKDIERFRWFSGGYVALDKNNPNRVVDVRYSMLPQEIKPLWGIELSSNAPKNQHADYYTDHADGSKSLKTFWGMLFK